MCPLRRGKSIAQGSREQGKTGEQVRFFRLFSGARDDEAARALYVAVVERGRHPGFYLSLGVPDSPDGRFDMIALHAFLVLRRLRKDQPRTADLAQALFDLMFADMDQNLREMGVGDLSVGRRVKVLAQAFYGRVAAYDAGLDGDDIALEDAVRRNVFRHVAANPAHIAALARYMRRVDRHLAGQELHQLAAGAVSFGSAPDGTRDADGEIP
jgi:cytochrome b pre-mRNA-processing protein 3